VDAASTSSPTLDQLRASHAALLATHARIVADYATLDARPVSYDILGNRLLRFHPEDGLPESNDLPSLSDITEGAGKDDENPPCKQAQRKFSFIRHHDRWGALKRDLSANGDTRELVRFVSVSQAFAGGAFNCVPSHWDFKIPSDELLVMCQRRLGLELSCLANIAGGASVVLGDREVDALGDTFLSYHNHSKRHNEVALVLSRAAKQALSRRVLVDTIQHEVISPGARPDVIVLRGAADGKHDLLLEVKVPCPISSNPDSTGEEGTYAAFANTAPDLKRHTFGCDSIGGRKPVTAHYAGAINKGQTVELCIFETFGGFEKGVVNLLNNWAARARGKTPEGEEPPWSARNFVPYWSQILSAKVQRGAAKEILNRVSEEAAARNAVHARSG
jgi:hypothetical protein